MDNIKIIRLQSGEDIIASYQQEEGDSTVFIKNPMTLMFKRLPTGKAAMLLMPWLPVELIETNAAYIYSEDILSVMQPKVSIIDYYTKSVEEMMLDAFERGNEIDEALQDLDSQESYSLDDMMESEEEDYDEEESRKELEELRMDIKKRLLH